ncbi:MULTISPECIES: DUF4327 family protein [Cyanophyceae]|uniref:DUF4327 family protein n=1 Tax=Cyanophyceae TaxID=3028117 RepID=UPI0016838EE3|nr:MULTISPECIES: DUF4327 family protein [Cyanophyceae]MBD1917475.1 DUF4327 family protein [Phormidium sp. FACHB-77]MBD2029650.1 DUF4327 family protein [Phormidium sp. FACHB-322]MBD2050911.1 DUF4327 family protein [Leptolyngbya sp. FACHB-60]
MTTTAANSTLTRRYTLDDLRDEAKQLVERGTLDRCQPICALCGYIAAREWPLIEAELESNDYGLRDRIGDLIPHETWSND